MLLLAAARGRLVGALDRQDLALSLTPSRCLTHTLPLSNSHTLSHFHTLALSLTHSLTLALSHTQLSRANTLADPCFFLRRRVCGW